VECTTHYAGYSGVAYTKLPTMHLALHFIRACPTAALHVEEQLTEGWNFV